MSRAGSSLREAVVVGAGVIGLTAARRLQQAGFRVRVLARAFSPRTTSDRAAAVWFPFKVEPAERVAAWAQASYRAYRNLAEAPASGVRFVDLVVVSRRRLAEPGWRTAEIPFERLPPDELPAGRTDGYRVHVPMVVAPRFLAWLRSEVEAAGGVCETVEVTALGAVCPPGGVVVNASGLGAAELTGDRDLFAIRGQTAIVRPLRPLGHLADDDDGEAPVYVLPRGDDEVVVGGTAVVSDDRAGHEPQPDRATHRLLLERATALEPGLAGCHVLRAEVGLRPGRSAVRLDAEPLPGGGRRIHCYGHGGAGFTLCWGCADEVAALAAR